MGKLSGPDTFHDEVQSDFHRPDIDILHSLTRVIVSLLKKHDPEHRYEKMAYCCTAIERTW